MDFKNELYELYLELAETKGIDLKTFLAILDKALTQIGIKYDTCAV